MIDLLLGILTVIGVLVLLPISAIASHARRDN